MKKILGKLLALILGIVIFACAIIVVCSIDSDAKQGASFVSGMIQKYIEENKEPVDETKEKSATDNSADKSVADAVMELADASSAISSYTVTETREKEYSDYAGNWSNSGIDQEVSANSGGPYVNEDLMLDETDETAYYSITDDLSSYHVVKPDIVELESSEQVLDALKETSMGSLGENESFSSQYYPYYSMLTDKCKALYKQIYANANNLKEEFLPVKKANTTEWQNAFMAVTFDHPELFWLNTEFYTEYDYNGSVVKVKLSFYDEFGKLEDAKAKFETMSNYIIAGTEELKSDYDKEAHIHNYLAGKLSYDLDAPLNQSAYSAIVADKTVCAGYAKAFQYLMQKIGIPTYFVAGWGGGLISGGMHGWNMVKLSDGFYNVDVTWDDQDPLIYNYFNKSDSDFHRHIRMYSSQFLPKCTGKKYAKQSG